MFDDKSCNPNGNNKRQKLNVIILSCSVLVQIESICLNKTNDI